MYMITCKKTGEKNSYYIYAEKDDKKKWIISKNEAFIEDYQVCLEIIEDIKSKPKCALENINITRV